jgi:hypothetical protein
MGTIKRGILGGFKNKVGSVIGSSWKGIDTMRSMPLSVANPRTAKQIAVRSNFKTLVTAASSVNSTLIRPYWSRFAKQMTGANAFIRENYANFKNPAILYSENAILSKGKLDMVTNVIVTDTVYPAPLEINFEPNAGTYGDNSDIVEFWGVKSNNAANNRTLEIKLMGATTRDEDVCDVPRSMWEEDDEFALYVTVRRADGTLVSNSLFTEYVQHND